MTLRDIFLIVAALCAIPALIKTYQQGYSDGQAALQAKHSEQTIKVLTAGLDEYRDAIAQSKTAIEASAVVSQQTRAVLAAAEKTNRSTTHDLRQLLADTAADRAGCRFDDSSMQQLGAARDRAAAAAAGTAPGSADATLQPTTRNTHTGG